MMLATKSSSDSSLDSTASEEEVERKVVFVLGDDEKLVGLKNKSNGGKSVKRSSRIQHEPVNLDAVQKAGDEEENGDGRPPCEQRCARSTDSPSKCCAQTLQHSKPIKHSGFKFEFDKYPQIVTNYMKSKNLEILDRHYIGKPGNLKLDNFQFDPTVVPPIQEERCEACYKCQMMESMLQTPTNASELEYMNDGPRQSDPQYAKESICECGSERGTACEQDGDRGAVRQVIEFSGARACEQDGDRGAVRQVIEFSGARACEQDGDRGAVRQVIEFSVPRVARRPQPAAGLDGALLGGLTDHYVPDLVLQGTISKPQTWEMDLRRDLDLASYLNKASDAGAMPVAIVGDTDAWEVRVVGREAGGGGGMSALVGAMLDALPAMCRARVPAYQCLLYLEGKLREFCVLSKTLADMLDVD
ncbi:uncharacterized protein LOC125226468 [Leguminivora glycinivorella]|uniref:uncharacterized protein LOC125226468 n=1 Tax=Leguminivora glycinivorella TaxID=1035111 RepID=UPI00200D1A7E|nr:uncharacterized protein LOC125226468 [Leguminivora glycinivorella]